MKFKQSVPELFEALDSAKANLQDIKEEEKQLKE
jgi:hypothetical protein